MINLKTVFFAICVIWSFPLAAQQTPPNQRVQKMSGCPTLQECMSILEMIAPSKYQGVMYGDEREIAINLLRFGEAAKQELLKRARAHRSGVQNLASVILKEWKNWSPSDIPALSEVLRKHNNGWLAGPLGEIGTHEAITVLVEDLENGTMGQTDGTLVGLGDKVLPYLLPLFESDDQHNKRRYGATILISRMGERAAPIAPTWVGLALDEKQPIKTRLAALRAISAMYGYARKTSEKLLSLLNDANTQIGVEARATLRSLKHPVTLEDAALGCQPMASEFERYPSSTDCVREIALYGEAAQRVGDKLLPFLQSKNGVERSTAITTLGFAGYKPAIPAIEIALNDVDWRVVYAAIRSLGWLGAKQSIAKLEAATAHWLPEAGELAQKVIRALRSAEGVYPRAESFSGGFHEQGEPFFIDNFALGVSSGCTSGKWRWKNEIFSMDVGYMQNKSLSFHDGSLAGTDNGEWGGELYWLSGGGGKNKLL